MYTGRANAPLDELAKLIGFPGKLGMDGSKVWDAYQQGKLAEIRNYCETDVVNTYLVFARFQLMRGNSPKHSTKKNANWFELHSPNSMSRTGKNSSRSGLKRNPYESSHH